VGRLGVADRVMAAMPSVLDAAVVSVIGTWLSLVWLPVVNRVGVSTPLSGARSVVVVTEDPFLCDGRGQRGKAAFPKPSGDAVLVVPVSVREIADADLENGWRGCGGHGEIRLR